jgi:lytic murein transglycosylase
MRHAVLSLCCAVFVTPVLALEASERPAPRPAPGPASQLSSAGSAGVVVFGADVAGVARSIRPVARGAAPLVVAQATSDTGFDAWVTGFRPRALAQGIPPDVFDRAFAGVRYDADVIKRDRNQSEFTKTLWDYLDTAVSETRIANGRAAMRRQADVLSQVEARYGVDRHIVAAIWGLESAFGSFRGSNDVIGSLATLAFDARRSAFFEEQLLAALQILAAGDVSARGMTGSWAGAMGHTQFMPTSYLDYAVDQTGDGKRDIWGDDPADALASTAHYLAKFGWVTGQPWGVEVRLPAGFDYALANRKILKRPGGWAQLGVTGLDGRAVPDHGAASILLPAGAKGAAFMIFGNFEVLERYNTADAYVIGVGHLADRLRGGGPIQASWPRGDRALSYDERIELQERLTARGFDTKKIDGKIGPLTIDAVRSYQRSAGLVPDGYASLRLLERLR